MLKREQPKYQKIIQAAVEVIAENGFHGAQISRIAKKAGVADGTIYLYFNNKEDLLVSLFRERMGHFIRQTERQLEAQTSAREKLKTLVSMHFKQLSGNYPMAIVTQLELRQSKKTLRAQINEVLKQYLNVIDRILEEGVQSGEFPGDLNIRLARQMIFGTLDETVTNWVFNDGRYNLNALAEEVVNMLLFGITRAEK